MQEAISKQTDIKMTVRKIRRVINLIRGKKVVDAQRMLKFMPYFAARIVEKNLNAAVSNAAEKFGATPDVLKISEVYADEAATYRRVRPRAQGRMYKRLKRTSHLTVKVAKDQEKNMGQKTHPTGFRVGIIEPWVSTWFARKGQYALNIAQDAVIRKFIKKKLYTAGVSRINIARKANNVNITVVTAKTGIVVGRGGQGIDELRLAVQKLIKSNMVTIDVVEVARIDVDAQLVAENIALQLEKRIAFRRAMKQAMQRTMRAGVQGIKVMVSGRLGGAEIARSEWAKEGRIPLQTLRADVQYGFAEADTIMGKIGVKVWVFKGDLLPGEKADQNIKAKKPQAKEGARPQRRSRRNEQNAPAVEAEQAQISKTQEKYKNVNA